MSLPSLALRRLQPGQLASVGRVLLPAAPLAGPSSPRSSSSLRLPPSTPSRARAYATSPFAPSSSPAPQFPDPASSDRDGKDEPKAERRFGNGMFPSFTNSPALDAALTTVVGLFLVFGSGTAYLAWYKVRPAARPGGLNVDCVLTLTSSSLDRSSSLSDGSRRPLSRCGQPLC